MSDLIATARTVANTWPALIGALPEELSALIGVFDEAGYAQGPNVAIDAAKITAKTVEQTITDLAAAIALEEKFAEAQRRVRSQLARKIIHVAGTAAPEVIETLRPKFHGAVSEFADAINALPNDISSAALVDAGPSALGAYQNAVAAAQVISDIDSWLASLRDLPAFAGHKPEPLLRVLNPTDHAEIEVLAKAHNASNVDPQLRRLNPLYIAAVRRGIEFEMHTPTETAKTLQRIESTPLERNPFGGFAMSG
ncbi:hypothetical protein [Mycobacterium sp.]|uniref:hypothetical protein n=1 Tax=Mycobacterium sp. TaxID=1785 RepID=UPI003BA956EF